MPYIRLSVTKNPALITWASKKREGEKIGLFDTVISRKEFEEFVNEAE
jgi:hypothetical protein